MPCCQCKATETHFDARVAERDLQRYRRSGPGKTARALIETIRQLGVNSASLLDIGSGVGIIAHELTGKEVTSATLVEAASAYLAAARKEAERRGYHDRLSYLHGDFVDLAADLPEADIVTLDRVICCYPDAGRLVSLSAAKSRRCYGLSVPRDRWYVKVVVALQNAMRRVRGDRFRTFIHPIGRINELIRSAGLRESFCDRGLVWQVALYVRDVDG